MESVNIESVRVPGPPAGFFAIDSLQHAGKCAGDSTGKFFVKILASQYLLLAFLLYYAECSTFHLLYTTFTITSEKSQHNIYCLYNQKENGLIDPNNEYIPAKHQKYYTAKLWLNNMLHLQKCYI